MNEWAKKRRRPKNDTNQREGRERVISSRLTHTLKKYIWKTSKHMLWVKDVYQKYVFIWLTTIAIPLDFDYWRNRLVPQVFLLLLLFSLIRTELAMFSDVINEVA